MSKDKGKNMMIETKFSTSEMIDERDVIPSFDCVLETCLDKTFNRSIGDRKGRDLHMISLLLGISPYGPRVRYSCVCEAV